MTHQRFLKVKKSLEDEIGVRLEFENKINKLNHYNRQLQKEIKEANTIRDELQQNYEQVLKEKENLDKFSLSQKQQAESFNRALQQEQLLKEQYKTQFESIAEKHNTQFDEVKLLKKDL